MVKPVYQLRIGTTDWEEIPQFYPDDLPEEWRLTYYANEHTIVEIPEERWRNADPETLEEWGDDVHERFQFVVPFTPNPSVPWEELEIQCSTLQTKLESIADRIATVRIIGREHPKQTITRCWKELPLAFPANPVSSANETENTQNRWKTIQNLQFWDHLATVEIPEIADPKELRELIELIQQQSISILLLTANRAAPDNIRQVEIITALI